jgi:hypothetical protein
LKPPTPFALNVRIGPAEIGGFNTILKEIEERAPLKRNVDQVEVGKTAAYLLRNHPHLLHLMYGLDQLKLH